MFFFLGPGVQILEAAAQPSQADKGVASFWPLKYKHYFGQLLNHFCFLMVNLEFSAQFLYIWLRILVYQREMFYSAAQKSMTAM